MYARHLLAELRAALADTPVVFLDGARQTGKTTLARAAAGAAESPRAYLTLDDLATLAAARRDPEGFIAGLAGPVTLDEVQRAPELFLAIKAAVDRDRRPGRFLLTGSSDALLMPRAADSLAGRMQRLTLWPLSQGEIAGRRESFVDALFSERPPRAPAGEPRAKLLRRVLHGGFPEALARHEPNRRAAWFAAYLDALVQRDIRELAHIEKLGELPRLLTLAAARASGLLAFSDLGRDLALPQTTLKRYFALLEAVHLVHLLPAWTPGRGPRAVKAPKLYFSDTGLLAHLRGADEAGLAADPASFGPLFEQFAVLEIRKAAAWSKVRPALHHFRTHGGREVDLILEDRRGRLVAIEIKATATPRPGDLAGITAFAEIAGKKFHRGVILHAGMQTVPFAAKIHAVPIGALWG